jgi:hypothetical protein
MEVYDVPIPGDEVPIERSAEDDHDLLTYGEAGARLRVAIHAMRVRIEELERTIPVEGTELAVARKRLAALEEGAVRNSGPRVDDANFENFFGYPGDAGRRL